MDQKGVMGIFITLNVGFSIKDLHLQYGLKHSSLCTSCIMVVIPFKCFSESKDFFDKINNTIDF